MTPGRGVPAEAPPSGGRLPGHRGRVVGVVLVVMVAMGSLAGAAIAEPSDTDDPVLRTGYEVPVILVSPNPPLDVRDVRVFGRHFCPDPACSSVTITLDGRVVGDGIEVEVDGRFVAPVSLRTLPGERSVVATQTLADGTEIMASETVVIPTVDFIEDQPSPPVTADPGGDAGDHADPGESDNGLPAATSPASTRTEVDRAAAWWWAGLAVVLMGVVVAILVRRRLWS